MARITTDEFERRTRVWLDTLAEKVERFAPAVFARWRARSIATYMRNARDEVGTRRSRADTGPLRILSGTLAGSTGAGGPNRPGVIERVRGEGLRVRLEKGVDLDRVPYARIHEKGGRAGRNLASVIPARSYIRPAVEDELPAIRRIAQRSLRDSFVREVAGR